MHARGGLGMTDECGRVIACLGRLRMILWNYMWTLHGVLPQAFDEQPCSLGWSNESGAEFS